MYTLEGTHHKGLDIKILIYFKSYLILATNNQSCGKNSPTKKKKREEKSIHLN